MPVRIVSTGSGGGTTPVGAVLWGPSFGVPPLSTTSTPALTKFGFQTNFNTTATPNLAQFALSGPTLGVSTTATPHGSILGNPWWQSVSENKTTATTTVTINKPTSTAQGDLLVAFIGITTNAGTGTLHIATPSGWTAIEQNSVGTAVLMTMASFYIIAGASEPSTYSFVCDNATPDELVGAIHRVQGNSSTPFLLSNKTSGTSAASSSINLPSITNTVDNTLNFFGAYHQHLASATHTPPASSTKKTDNEVGTTIFCLTTGIRVMGTAGAYPSVASMACSQVAAAYQYISQVASFARGSLTIG